MGRIATSIGSARGTPLVCRNCLPVVGLAILAASLAWSGTAASAADVETGKVVFKEECARCHGPMGDGTKHTTRPLVGEKSATQLVPLLKHTMPEDDPGSLGDDQYKKVASYIYDAFYSPDAQARLHPPRIVLSHLTVGQYRGTVADLIGTFRPTVKLDGRRGLRGEYFNSKDIRGDRRLIDRLDPEVNFDFGTGGPDAGSNEAKFNPEQFCIRWEGSVSARETGDYEFVVHTEQALRLWVNDVQKPAIDAFVKSGQDTEYRASVFLIAGRSYPIRLEVFKGREVNDKKKKKGPVKPATESVALLWRLPGRQADELVPSRCLSPVQVPEVAVIRTPFPPDDRSYGWERGTDVSKEWVSATTDAALDVAEYVSAHLPELAGVGNEASDRAARLRAFCRAFAERAFRRPLSDAEKREIVDRQFDESHDLDEAVKRVVIRVMISPEFLYPDTFDDKPTAGGPEKLVVAKPAVADGYAVASRLALVLWDSLPDPALLKAAAEGKLSTHDQIAEQARRMLDDPRAKLKVREFLLAWLRVDQPPELVKDAKKYPAFSPAVASDLRTSLEMFLDDVVSNDNADFSQLLLSDNVFLNGRLAKFYGADLAASASTGSTGSANSPRAGSASSPRARSERTASTASADSTGSTSSPQAGSPRAGPELTADADFAKVALGEGRRAGVLTQPYMLAAFAYPGESSPIHRGVFIIRGILGVTLRPPANAAFTPLPPGQHPNLTTRERIALQTSPDSCVACHGVINPLGFALENFDAVGRYRRTENGKPIDVSGHYETRSGPVAQFAGARGLAQFLAGNEEAHDAFAQQMFQQLVKQPVRAYGLDTPQKLRETFARSGYNIRKLLVEIAVIASQR